MKNNKLKLLWILFAFIGLFVISSCNNNNNSNDGDSNKTTQSATFTVVWKDGNGKVIETDKNVKYGETPKYNGATPTKKSTVQYEYTFSGWSPELKAVTSNVTYTAQFTESLVKYLISWNNEDGTPIKSTEVEYGKMPVFDGVEPTKTSTIAYDYKFSGWSPALEPVTKSKSYKAVFSRLDRYYNISFVNFDGSLLYSEKVKANSSISSYALRNIKPIKENDENYSYTFTGWTPSVSAATSDQVYTAQYSRTPLPYIFKFNLNGGVCLSGIDDKKTNRLDKRDFKFDLQKDGKAFRGWEYRGQLIFDKNGNLKIDAKNFEFCSIMEFDALYEDECHVSIQYKINGSIYYELPEEVGVASASAFYPAHGDVSVSASAKAGYKFDGWYQGSSKITTNNTYSYTLWESDMTLTAVYSFSSYYLSARTDDSAVGDIQLLGGNATNSLSVLKAYNTNITIYARSKDDKKFLGWYDNNGELLSTSETYSFKMPNSNYSIIAKWNCFYINYDLDGGTNDSNNPSWYSTDMSNITLLSPRKEGYSFTGWEYNGQIIESIDTSDMCNMNLKATYTPLTYRIDLNSNGGSIDENYVDVNFDSQYDLPIPAKVGYKFEGWYCDDIQMTDDEGKSLSNYSLPSNETFIATYSLIPYQLEFDTNGGEFVHTNLFNVTFDENYDGGHIKNVSLGFDEKLEYPTIPSREGYYFSGWYLEPTCKTPYTFSNEIVEDFVLYAKWVSLPNNTDVMFGMEAYGNDMNDYFSYDPAGYEQSRPDYILVRANETGTHCIYYRSGTNATTASTSSYYKIGISIVNLSTNMTILANTINTLNWHNISFTATIGDVICIGVYRNNSYNVYAHLAFSGFTKLESTAKTSNIIGITYGSAFEYPTVKRDGYTFDGWTLNGNNYDSNNWNNASDGKLVARWIPNSDTKYIVEHYQQNAENDEFVLIETDELIGTTETETKANHKTYEGFSEPEVTQDIINGDGSTTVKIYYYRNIHKITLNVSLENAGSVEGTGSNKYDQKIIILANTNPGYTFVGWFEGDNELTSELVYSFNMPDKDICYEAKWIKVSLRINNDLAGDISTLTGKYRVGEEVKIDAKANVGYTFIGWFEGNNQLTSNTSYIFNMPNINLSYEAIFVINKYKVNVEKNIYDDMELLGASNDNTYDYNMDVTLKVTNIPSGKYLIWYVNDKAINVGENYTFKIPDRDLNIRIELSDTLNNIAYIRNNNKIFFGTYPQMLLDETENESLIAELNCMAGSLPTEMNSYNWIAYTYFTQVRTSDYIYYQDIDYDKDGIRDYRGVYFIQYRPENSIQDTSVVLGTMTNTYQDDNGYNINKVYWFEYCLIEWDILNESNGEVLLIANLILDSQEFYPSLTSEQIQHNGGMGYVNNYELSDVRNFLINDFYNTAFGDLQKYIIKLVEVDNSSSTNTNIYACNNTLDRVFLLSYNEAVTYIKFGFDRKCKGTDYAKCMGLYVTPSTSYEEQKRGFSNWWLRTYSEGTEYSSAYSAYSVFSDGSLNGNFVYTSCTGVRPCCYIIL